jgi:copper chaperone CopZ
MKPTCPFDPLDPLEKNLPPEERQALSFAQFYVLGMGCSDCASLIRNSLIALPEVVSAEVDYVRWWAEVVFNPDLTGIPLLIEAINQAGGESKFC